MIIIIGIFIMGCGSACNYTADIGGSSVGTMIQGISRTYGISEGLADVIISSLFLLPMFFIAKDMVGIGTLISMFGIGISVNIGKMAIDVLNIPDSIPARLLLYFASMIMGSFGSSLYVSAGSGIGSFDAIILLLYRLTKLEYSTASIVVNSSLLIAGFLLGGTVGLGTVIGILAGSFVSQFFMKRVHKLIGKESPLQKSNVV